MYAHKSSSMNGLRMGQHGIKDISQHIRFESHRKNDLKIWFLQGDELFKCINEVMNSNTTSLQ